MVDACLCLAVGVFCEDNLNLFHAFLSAVALSPQLRIHSYK